jgi:cellulose synthase/poly-beta-1,6-N-acetylglucosamine synthase-like glycosyltransferase
MTIAEASFWVCIFCIAFAYAGHTLVILVLSRIVRNPVRIADIEPRVTLLITAYNEEKQIGQKLERTMSLDYPRDKLEIIVASDGSVDRTDEIVRGYADRGVRLIRVEGRVGKTETQNRAVLECGGEIIVFSDATTIYEHSAIRKLVRNFADPAVGAVAGRFHYINPGGTPIGLGNILFWKYETLIKSLQTSIRTVTGCSGCIYAVRRSLYQPLPADIISDLCEPLKIVEQGFRVVFEAEAVAAEETTERAHEEFNMRVRVVTRGMRGMLYMRALLNPLRYGFVAFQLWSHKIARWLVPIFAAGAFVANALLATRSLFYGVVFGLHLAFYATALFGYIAERWQFRARVLAVPLYFVTINLASIVAMVRVVRGYRAVTWETARK